MVEYCLLFQLSTLQAQLVIDKHTEPLIACRRLELQKEAVELTSILRQHQDVSQSLVSVCQRYASRRHFRLSARIKQIIFGNIR